MFKTKDEKTQQRKIQAESKKKFSLKIHITFIFEVGFFLFKFYFNSTSKLYYYYYLSDRQTLSVFLLFVIIGVRLHTTTRL